jgi:hypothetical protein
MSMIIFFQLLDFPHLRPARPSILRVICTLSKKFCLHPTTLELPGVSRFEAVRGGGFGGTGIWKGNVGRDVVAIKIICDRNANPTVMDIKVSPQPAHFPSTLLKPASERNISTKPFCGDNSITRTSCRCMA